jgi:Animal haem peroxidase
MGVSATAPTVARDQCLAPGRPRETPVYGGRYRRMFEGLEPLEADEALLHGLGTVGGLCDGAPLDGSGEDDAEIAAGWPFFGQFVAHDITADRSPLVHRADPEALRNSRTPRANLECVYGGGPVGSPYLYHRDDPARMLLSEGGGDVPRNPQGVALIGDPRNDVHLFMNQFHVAFLRAHNLLVDLIRADGVPGPAVFEKARFALTWHYQWVLLNDFLPTLIGDRLAEELLAEGPSRYCVDCEPYIPFEFADAAYRYGHSQIRHRYRINDDQPELPLFPDLMGFGPVAPEMAVDWSLLFDVDGPARAQRAKRIDGRLPASLINLPVEVTGEVADDAYRSLAARDLQRGQATALPSGEAVARELGVEPLTSIECGLADYGWEGETPLWLYVLREADARQDGERLGEVGGRIVGEVLVGIVDSDPESYRTIHPDWVPTLPSADPGRYTLADLVRTTELS